MIRSRRTRILVTLGPASKDPEVIKALAEAGADVFRLNMSHGSHDDHARNYASVRAAEAQLGRPLGILADLQGPKFRLGRFVDGFTPVSQGQNFQIDLDTDTLGDGARVGIPHPEFLGALHEGSALLIDDGKVRLRVTHTAPGVVQTRVEAGDRLSNNKGLSAPGIAIPVPALTEKDREDLAFALRMEVDWIALSFVQRPSDVAELRRLVGRRAAIMAKIEKPSAVDDLGPILDLCDGVMVARGDLGVELEPEEVPVVQRDIIRAARQRGIPVVVATQMLDSMTHSPAPTRAEVSDVAGAVYEGTDAVMLSGETAAGDFPVDACAMMDRIIRRVERDPRWPELMAADRDPFDEIDTDVLVAAARRAADASSTACLVAFTATGTTARKLSRERPLQAVLALTPNSMVAHQLTLVWGLEPRVAKDPNSMEEMTDEAVGLAFQLGMTKPGARILILAGTPFGAPGAANLLRFAHAPMR